VFIWLKWSEGETDWVARGMGRSRKLTLTDWTAANNGLIQCFEGNKSKLAKHVKLSRTTITKFFKAQPLGESSVRKICLALRLNWQQVSSVEPLPDSPNAQPSDLVLPNQADEVLLEEIRECCRHKIMAHHSQMRLLSGAEIGVDQLYVDVWLLEKPEYRHFNSPESLLNRFDITMDRLALSKRIGRDLGFEIANRNPKLVILGKPGSGKTTFLKHLAVDWCKGQFQPEKIAVLIELRQIREPTWSFVDAISQELELPKAQVLSLLEQGKLLILLDGLDEVPSHEIRRYVQEELKKASSDFKNPGSPNKIINKNRFILTCRTQIMEIIPNGFTSVEMADFNAKQVRQFVQNWFVANGQSKIQANDQWQEINRVTSSQPDLQELTATPVLLSLICLVLQDEGQMPTNRSWLYRKGIKLLLSRWNEQKAIADWQVGTEVYRQLTLEAKEALLTEIAARKFEDPQNFVLFDQDELADHINQHLQLSNKRAGMGILKAIETQHGLLIERADELWSFSHLTFQEYFTFEWLIQFSPQQLTLKIVDQQWQRVVEQLVKSQQPGDRLLYLIKQATDQYIAQEPVIQTFLGWLGQKSASLATNGEPAAIRAFYFSLAVNRDFDLDHPIDYDLSHDLDRSLNRLLGRASNPTLDYSLNRALDLSLDHRTLELEHPLNHDDRDRDLDRALKRVFDRALDTFDLTLNLDHQFPNLNSINLNSLYFELDRVYSFTHDFSPDLLVHLVQLQEHLPKCDRSQEIEHWWKLHGSQWIEQLRQIMIKHRNIGHDWQFTPEQRQQLWHYYKANKFLVDLLKIPGAVSEKCRTEIEAGLLLPWAELKRRQPHR
jgi:hypothetical protein